MYVTDKVEDFVEVKCYALNCILKLFPRPGLFQGKFEVNTRVKSIKTIHNLISFFRYNKSEVPMGNGRSLMQNN